MCYIAARMWRLGLACLLAILPACDGIEDIPDDRIVCCRNGDRLFTVARIDCVYDPDGRVVAYALCADGGADASVTDAAIFERD